MTTPKPDMEAIKAKYAGKEYFIPGRNAKEQAPVSAGSTITQKAGEMPKEAIERQINAIPALLDPKSDLEHFIIMRRKAIDAMDEMMAVLIKRTRK
jgi:hypothetical protein